MIYVGVVAQSSLVPLDVTDLGRPFVPAVILVLIANSCHPATAIAWSAVLGMLLDGISTEKLGIQLSLAAMLGLGIQVMRSMWMSRSFLALVVMTLLTCFAWRALSPMTLAALSGRTLDPNMVLGAAVRDTVCTGIVGSVVILIVRGLFGPGNQSATARSKQSPRWQVATR